MMLPPCLRLCRTLLLAGAVILVPISFVLGEAPPSDGGLAAKLRPFVDNQTIAGCVLLVANKDRILDLETAGYSDIDKKTPMQPDNLFWIASMTKSFTAVALMMMVDEGKVNINDPVEKYLPEFKGQMVVDQTGGNPAPHAPSHPITVRECMSHTAALTEKPKQHWVLQDDVAEIAKAPLEWEPGTKFRYNNAGINVGGYLVQVLSGMPYGDFIRQRLLDPLEMKDTTFWPTDAQASHFAKGGIMDPVTKRLKDRDGNEDLIANVKLRGTVPPILLTQMTGELLPTYAKHYAMPAGGLYSTAEDISKFCRMLLNGGTYKGKTYISPASLKLMTTNETGGVPVNPTEGYGLGYFVQKAPSDDGPSVGSFGHRGAPRTAMWVDPNNGLVLVILQHASLTGAQQKAEYTAFFKNAIARYGKNPSAAASRDDRFLTAQNSHP
jgi:CubicO group peptidase (beta-lactamase class C family)